jgi:AAA ATPase domain
VAAVRTAVCVTRTLGTVARDRRANFVGREAERAFLLDLLEDDGPAIAFVSGIAGIGKSALLDAFAAEAAAAGAVVVALDGEAVEPTAAGFLRALSAALGTELGTTDAAVAHLGALRPRVVLAIDAYERLRLLDDWLRRVLVGSLPDRARVAIAGRDAPVAAWSAAYGPLLRALELDSLGPGDAVALLGRLGVPPNRAVPLNRALRGHPLSLGLAASTPAALGPSGDDGLQPAIDELARTYLTGLDADTRAALDAASVVRRVTVPLLGALLPGARGEEVFGRLRELPFVRLGGDGLAVHHVVREAVASELRSVDPPRYRALRTAAWRQLRDELSAARDDELWRYTADMLYLLESPAVRDAFFPMSAPLYSVEPAAEGDAQAIAAIARRHEPAAGAELARAWWDAAPGAFYVARGADGGVAGFSALCEPGDVSVRLLDADPVAAGWRAHLRGAPLARGERALFIRFMCGAESGERPAPDVAALYLDLKRTYLTMRPALRRVYTCAHEIDAMGETLEPLGFEPFGDPPPTLGGVPYELYCNDMGPGSVEGWLARLAARDVLAGDAPLLDPDERRLLLDGERIDLTPLEYGVLACLHDRTGAVVRRETLLREVWGHEWDGDGNALESVVSSLRRKLGPRAEALETARGVGYRLRAL